MKVLFAILGIACACHAQAQTTKEQEYLADTMIPLAREFFARNALPKNSGEHLFEVIMRRYENRSTIMTSNRPLEEWGKLLGDVPTAGAILDRFLHHSQTIAITGRSYRLKDHAAAAGKEEKNKKTKSKSNENSTAEPAS